MAEGNKLSDIAGAIARVAIPTAAAYAAQGDPRLGYSVGQSIAGELFPDADAKLQREAREIQIKNAQIEQKNLLFAASQNETTAALNKQNLAHAENKNKLSDIQLGQAKKKNEFFDRQLQIEMEKNEIGLTEAKDKARTAELTRIMGDVGKTGEAVRNEMTTTLNTQIRAAGGEPAAGKEYSELTHFRRYEALLTAVSHFGLMDNLGEGLSETEQSAVNKVLIAGGYNANFKNGTITFATKDGPVDFLLTKDNFSMLMNNAQDEAIVQSVAISKLQNAKTAGQRAISRNAKRMYGITGDAKGAHAFAELVMSGLDVQEQHGYGLATVYDELVDAYLSGNSDLAARIIDESESMLGFEGDVIIGGATDANGNLNPMNIKVAIPVGSSTAKVYGLDQIAEAEGGYYNIPGKKFSEIAKGNVNDKFEKEIQRLATANRASGISAKQLQDLGKSWDDMMMSPNMPEILTGFIEWSKQKGVEGQLDWSKVDESGIPAGMLKKTERTLKMFHSYLVATASKGGATGDGPSVVTSKPKSAEWNKLFSGIKVPTVGEGGKVSQSVINRAWKLADVAPTFEDRMRAQDKAERLMDWNDAQGLGDDGGSKVSPSRAGTGSRRKVKSDPLSTMERLLPSGTGEQLFGVPSGPSPASRRR